MWGITMAAGNKLVILAVNLGDTQIKLQQWLKVILMTI